MRINDIVATICGYKLCGDWCPFFSDGCCVLLKKAPEEILFEFERFVRIHPEVTEHFNWTEYKQFRSKFACTME